MKRCFEELEISNNIIIKYLTENFENENLKEYELVLFTQDQEKLVQKLINKHGNEIPSICIGKLKKKVTRDTEIIELPLSLQNFQEKLINKISRSNFTLNSKIKIKNYILDKNERKLKNNSKSVDLTEMEIYLIELLLNEKKPVSKTEILKSVWKYSSDSDTHTVETHIYRLRQKIKKNFLDEDFIINKKEGYLI